MLTPVCIKDIDNISEVVNPWKPRVDMDDLGIAPLTYNFNHGVSSSGFCLAAIPGYIPTVDLTSARGTPYSIMTRQYVSKSDVLFIFRPCPAIFIPNRY